MCIHIPKTINKIRIEFNKNAKSRMPSLGDIFIFKKIAKDKPSNTKDVIKDEFMDLNTFRIKKDIVIPIKRHAGNNKYCIKTPPINIIPSTNET